MSADANSAFNRTFAKRSQSFSELTASRDQQNPDQPTPPDHSLFLSSQSHFAQKQHVASSMQGVLPALGSLARATWNDGEAAANALLESSIAQMRTRIQQILTDQVTPLRVASHIAVLLVGAAVLVFSQITMPTWDVQFQPMPTSALGGPSRAISAIGSSVSGLVSNNAIDGLGALQRGIVPITISKAPKREEIGSYVVQAGDTVFGIASRFNLRPETLQWANPKLEQNPDLLSIGDDLRILPFDGLVYTVRNGDTLSTIASRFKVAPEAIVAFSGNNLAEASAPLVVGTDIVVPGGTKPFVPPQIAVAAAGAPAPADALKGSGSFGWPSIGQISQNYWGGHPGIDIASRTGNSVVAADGGYVSAVGGGWSSGYGNHVLIDHGNGFVTLYAHLNSVFVRPGENVTRGEQIGTVGNTGNSTGSHLHFEIRYQGGPRNPYNFLP